MIDWILGIPKIFPTLSALVLSFMIMMGGSGFVLGPLLLAMWLSVAGSSANTRLHEVVVDAAVGLHEVVVIVLTALVFPIVHR